MSGSRRQKSVFWKGRVLDELRPRVDLKTPDLEMPTFHYDAIKFAPVALFLAVVFGIIFLQMGLGRPTNACAFKIPKAAPGLLPGRLTECVELEVAQTDSALQLGLSRREQLPRNKGMLFDFGISGEQCIWMQDMRFDIDALWLDEAQRIVHVEKNLGPETHPRLFCSPTPANYVIEVNAGIVDAAGLQLKQQLIL